MSAREDLHRLAHNLWWSWDTAATALWPAMDRPLWEKVEHNPVAFLEEVSAEALEDEEIAAGAADAVARMDAYLNSEGWAAQAAPEVQARGVAYLSMEFGLHESLPLYSGGLGVLAGDHLRSASDLGVNLIGIGIFWHQGYFRQDIEDGRQVARYPQTDPILGPYTPVMGDGERLVVHVPIGEHDVRLWVWVLHVGRVPLFLFDASHPDNPDAIKQLTGRLYGGDASVRIQQEALLGLGAVRLMEALEQPDRVVHMNEGHCAFAPLQQAAHRLGQQDWESACRDVAAHTVFTTHTPVPAGHDRFGWSDVNGTLGPWRRQLGLPDGAFMDLGRVHPTDLNEPLCMTVLALRLSAAANGVSKLHGQVSRQMWGEMWPDLGVDDVPIGHVTNGVHPTFWVSDPSRALFDAHVPGWRERIWDPAVWAQAADIPDDSLKALRDANRAALVALVAERTGTQLDPTRLTLGFARRFAPYKRGDLVFRDPDRLHAWLDQGAQLIYAGKAHPKDIAGQELLATVARWADDPRFSGKVVLIPDYDIAVGRAITAGADVWLNNPRRPREASGTSGQKVVYNGGLNLSVLDGWWPEGFDGTHGWAIGDGRTWQDIPAGDAADGDELYRLLEEQVWPAWDGGDWWQRVRRNFEVCAPLFSSHRMVRDYVLDLYRPRC